MQPNKSWHFLISLCEDTLHGLSLLWSGLQFFKQGIQLWKMFMLGEAGESEAGNSS